MRKQHWRLADATWRLVYLLQKANDTAASLTPQIPKLVRRLTPTTTPEGSLRPRGPGTAANTAEETGAIIQACKYIELAAMLAALSVL